MTDSAQPQPWDLTAPESLVLLWGPQTGDTWAFSLALLELAVRYQLDLREIRRRKLIVFSRLGLMFTGPMPHGNTVPPPLARLAATLQMFRDQHGGEARFAIDEAVHAELGPAALTPTRNPWAARPGSVWVRQQVLPVMQQKGLYELRLPLVDPVLTAEGLERLTELRRLLTFGRDWRQGTLRPTAALVRQWVRQSGSATLLVRGLPTLLDRLGTLPDEAKVFENGASSASAMPAVTLESLRRRVGPSPDSDLESALFAITAAVERQWARSYRQRTGSLVLSVE